MILVSVDPLNDCEQITNMLEGVRERVPHAKQFALLLPSPFENPDLKTCVFPNADHVSRSYDDVLHSCQLAMKGRDN